MLACTTVIVLQTTSQLTHAGESFNHSCASQDKHRRDNDVGQDAKYKENNVRSSTPTCTDNFQNGVRSWRLELDLHGQDTKKDDLRNIMMVVKQQET